ncbi:ACT domain-containing protein [Brucepastera parasyntrophica]|uniref:ACT domain-containing protein n=1 Tax=Brucepastera parasyntrophica TaxID=2880008 RepID=UPI002109CAD5|nr:ACT domain-containing protein [Brucepastera parasyntrophica]ULQ60233.1 ACT domain-containing protein [Brucepastera parasyntrophica]
MKLKHIRQSFAVCKLEKPSPFSFHGDFVFLAQTEDEISLVCRSDHIPENVLACEDGWEILKIEGSLDFSLTGIIAGISSVLSERQIPVFVVSTFNTDYILVKAVVMKEAIQALEENGYSVV